MIIRQSLLRVVKKKLQASFRNFNLNISVPIPRKRLNSFLETPPFQAVKDRSASSLLSLATCTATLADKRTGSNNLSECPGTTCVVIIPVSTISAILIRNSPIPFPWKTSLLSTRIRYVVIEGEDTARNIGLRVKAFPVGYMFTFKVWALSLILM